MIARATAAVAVGENDKLSREIDLHVTTRWAALALAAACAGGVSAQPTDPSPPAAQSPPMADSDAPANDNWVGQTGNALSYQYAHGLMSHDERQIAYVAYDHWFASGFGIGASLGVGDLLRNDDGKGLYLAGRLEYRLAGLAVVPEVKPKLGVELVVTTFVVGASGSDGWGAFAGAEFDVAKQGSLSVDLWAGRARSDGVTADRHGPASDNVRLLRVGYVHRF